MKKFLVLALALVLGLASMSVAATSQDTETFTISVIVTTGTTGIQLLPAAGHPANSINLGTLAVDSHTIFGGDSNRIIINNNGDTNVNLNLRATDFGSWALQAGAYNTAITAVDQCRLSGVFTVYTYTPVAGDFSADDAITTAQSFCSNTVNGIDSEPNGGIKGDAMLPTQDRSLMLAFDAPIAGSTGLGLNATSTLTIEANQY